MNFMKTSYPKSKIKVLLAEGIHARGVDALTQEGYDVEVLPDSLDTPELAERIKDISILGIRSNTQVTEKVLKNANKLLAIGAFCIGTNQVDLPACSLRGVAVFNAPYSNTRSVVELVIGKIIMLMRYGFDRCWEMHQGIWNKTSANCYEVRGKTLGIVGYGNIGTQLSILAENLGMRVLYYDILEKLALGNAQKCKTLEELLKKADVVTLHVDGRASNKNLFSDKEFKLMKKGALFLNLSRGHIVDIEALKKHLESGHLGGAGLDVFPEEPIPSKAKFSSILDKLPNVILTPHIGGATQEAQKAIAEYVPTKLMDYVNTGNSFDSVNFPNIQLPQQKNSHRLLHIHANVPGIMANVNSIFARNHMNIVGQYLKTSETMGYLITDVDKNYNKAVIEDLKKVPNTIKFRVLY